jgi:hypothetical protein
VDAESYKKIKKALDLLKILAQGEQDIAGGQALPQEDFFADLDQRFDQLQP